MYSDKKNSFAAYHIRQVVGLAVSGLVLGVINIIPILGWIVSFLGFIFLFVLWVAGLLHAISGRQKPVPVLGKYFQDWFKGI